jgi:hypothetical protein
MAASFPLTALLSGTRTMELSLTTNDLLAEIGRLTLTVKAQAGRIAQLEQANRTLSQELAKQTAPPAPAQE